MKIQFTEYTKNDPEYNADPAYKYGGFITVTAESLEDSRRIVEYFKLSNGNDPDSVIARAELLKNPELTHEHRPKKRPYYEVSGSLDVQLFQPYQDWAKQKFGYDGAFPNLQIPFKWAGLRHVFVGISQEIQCHETVCYTVATQAKPWNGRNAQQYAERNVSRYIEEDFGHVEPVREFIEAGNGHYKRNPDYATGKRNPVQARCTHEGLMKLFAQWWLENGANDAQRDILAKNAELTGKHSRVNFLRDYGIYYADPAGKCNYDGKGLMASHMGISEFAALS